MRSFRNFFLLLTIPGIWMSACAPRYSSKFASYEDVEFLAAKDTPKAVRSTCDTSEYYAPDPLHPDHRPAYRIRVNFHFLNSTDGKNNIPRNEQLKYVKDLTWVLNKSLETNMEMWLPPGNNTPALPIPFRYALAGDPEIPGDQGVYEHIDDELYYFVKSGRYRNNSDMRVIRKYASRDDSILNIFLMPHHPDSVASRTYRADGSGIALGTSLKVAGQWNKKPDPWGIRGLFHHEICHILGLSHTWNANDGCEDTPKHPNCFNKSDKPPCDSLYSNNVMDYNAHQAAWSPCQLGKIVRHFSTLNSRQRKLLDPVWCRKKDGRIIEISEDIYWLSARDVDADILVREGGRLTIRCRTSMPAGGKITVAPGGRLILDGATLHNSCGDLWEGIEVQKLGKKTGHVIIISPSNIEDTIHPVQPNLE